MDPSEEGSDGPGLEPSSAPLCSLIETVGFLLDTVHMQCAVCVCVCQGHGVHGAAGRKHRELAVNLNSSPSRSGPVERQKPALTFIFCLIFLVLTVEYSEPCRAVMLGRARARSGPLRPGSYVTSIVLESEDTGTKAAGHLTETSQNHAVQAGLFPHMDSVT